MMSEYIHDSSRMCMFCGEYNESFDPERLDEHYLNECALLRKCESCNEVLEICTLKEHYLSECVGKENYRQCSRCKEPIEKTKFPQHRAKVNCKLTPGDSTAGRCVLCHKDIEPNNDIGWRRHLMNECEQNTLRGILKKRGSTSNGEQVFVPR